MTPERCYCGDTECRRCYPYMPTVDEDYDEDEREIETETEEDE
jgi:hypothetical protein